MNEKLKIEPISNRNFEEFFHLITKLAEYEHLDPPDKGAKRRLKRDALSRRYFSAYLGRFEGQAAGYLIYFMTYSSFLAMPTLYIEDIFVLEEFRRKGIGTELFRFCVQKAKENGCGRIEWCVLTWNTPAIRFYEKQGGVRLDWYFYRMTGKQIDEFLSNR